jgi:hypothetical protein
MLSTQEPPINHESNIHDQDTEADILAPSIPGVINWQFKFANVTFCMEMNH